MSSGDAFRLHSGTGPLRTEDCGTDFHSPDPRAVASTGATLGWRTPGGPERTEAGECRLV